MPILSCGYKWLLKPNKTIELDIAGATADILVHHVLFNDYKELNDQHHLSDGGTVGLSASFRGWVIPNIRR
jgi:hypothetical protein